MPPSPRNRGTKWVLSESDRFCLQHNVGCTSKYREQTPMLFSDTLIRKGHFHPPIYATSERNAYNCYLTFICYCNSHIPILVLGKAIGVGKMSAAYLLRPLPTITQLHNRMLLLQFVLSPRVFSFCNRLYTSLPKFSLARYVWHKGIWQEVNISYQKGDNATCV